MTKTKGAIQEQEFVAPDGGWGWMIVLGAGMSTMVLISVLQSFGLIYKGRFEQLQFSVTDTTSIISVNSSFGMIVGIFNGPLLKKFGYRKIAITGGILFVSGIYYTVFAETYVQFLVSYGMVASIGTSMSMASFSLALNTYFKLRRSLASSLSITVMGMGPIVLPLLVTQLLNSYGWKWTALILAAITMNTFVGALLLQPVKWHIRPRKEDETHLQSGDSLLEKLHQTTDTGSLFGYGTSFLDMSDVQKNSHHDASSGKWKSQNSLDKYKNSNYQNGGLFKKMRSVASLDNDDYGDMMKSTLYVLENSTPNDRQARYASIETLDQKSPSCILFDSDKSQDRSIDTKCTAAELPSGKDSENYFLANESVQNKKNGCLLLLLNFIKRMYDVDLLLDPIYINLLVGLAIATVGEIIFSVLTPFILIELGLSLSETALFMSVTAITDVIFRFLTPFIGQCCNLNSRIMYTLSIFTLLLTRGSLLFVENIIGFLIVAVFLGVGKGFRTVYWILVVPDYVPLNKLASASAFQSLGTGISLFIFGPVIGAIVANNNNKYINVVFAANFMTLTTIILWVVEFIIVYRKRQRLKALRA